MTWFPDLLAAAAIGATTPMPVDVPRELRACADQGDFAPYTYATRDPNGGPVLTGYSVDYLRDALGASGRTVNITRLPWKRCVALAEQGQFDFVLDVVGSAERRRQFRLTQAHSTVTPILIYSLARPPADVHSAEQLARLKRCSVLGWDYTNAGVPAASAASTAPSSIDSAFAMLRAGRCDGMIYELELLRGLTLIDGADRIAGLGYRRLPWKPASTLHYGVSRQVSYSESLQSMLNKGGQQLQKTGAADRLRARYLKK